MLSHIDAGPSFPTGDHVPPHVQLEYQEGINTCSKEAGSQTLTLDVGEASSMLVLEGSRGLFCPASSGKVSCNREMSSQVVKILIEGVTGRPLRQIRTRYS